MHETGIARDLLRSIEAELAKLSYKKLLRVRIGIGALAGIEGDHLIEHLEEIAPGSVIDGVELETVELEPEFSCRKCGQTISERVVPTRCPSCGSDQLALVRGKDLTILSVDVE